MNEMIGFSQFGFEAAGTKKTVFYKGDGPGILLMHELPGMIAECVALARHIEAQGYCVFLPLLFGEPDIRFSRARTALLTARICVSREILAFAEEKDSPITTWLRALAREIRRRCPNGRGIGVIGMCLTGGFVINLMVEDVVLAPVACQPSLPFTLFGASRASLGVSAETLRAAVHRAPQAPLLCYRFAEDKISPRERFARLEREFSPAFEGHNLPGRGHATLTVDFADTPGHPTHTERDRIMRFFHERLRA